MKNHIDGYYNFEIIKGYQRFEDKIVVNYLNGYSVELDVRDEDKILVLMEKQGRDYAKEFDDRKNYMVKVVTASTGLVILLFGSLHGMEQMCINVVNDEALALGAIVGGTLVASDMILFKKLFKNLASKIALFEDQEKYEYYFKNKVLLDRYITINDLDDCALSELYDVVKGKGKKRVRGIRKR